MAELFALFAAWSIHNLSKFVDKVFGFVEALEHTVHVAGISQIRNTPRLIGWWRALFDFCRHLFGLTKFMRVCIFVVVVRFKVVVLTKFLCVLWYLFSFGLVWPDIEVTIMLDSFRHLLLITVNAWTHLIYTFLV